MTDSIKSLTVLVYEEYYEMSVSDHEVVYCQKWNDLPTIFMYFKYGLHKFTIRHVIFNKRQII